MYATCSCYLWYNDIQCTAAKNILIRQLGKSGLCQRNHVVDNRIQLYKIHNYALHKIMSENLKVHLHHW